MWITKQSFLDDSYPLVDNLLVMMKLNSHYPQCE